MRRTPGHRPAGRRRGFYCPQLEALEIRLPPGDVLGLGSAAWAGLGWPGWTRTLAPAQAALGGDAASARRAASPAAGPGRCWDAAAYAPPLHSVTSAVTQVSVAGGSGQAAPALSWGKALAGPEDFLALPWDLDPWTAPTRSGTSAFSPHSAEGLPATGSPAAGAEAAAANFTTTNSLGQVPPGHDQAAGSDAATLALLAAFFNNADDPAASAIVSAASVQTLPIATPPHFGLTSLLGSAFGADGGNPAGMGWSESGSVRYFDGRARVPATDLISYGYGAAFGHRRAWDSQDVYAANQATYPHAGRNGWGQVVADMPWLIQNTSGPTTTIIAVTGSGTERFFDLVSTNPETYQARFFVQDKLTHQAGQFTLADSQGSRLYFYDFSAAVPASRRGQFKGLKDAFGNDTTVTLDPSDRIDKVQRVGTSVETFAYTYVPTGQPNAGLLSNVQLRRGASTSEPGTVIRQVDYAYYGSGESYGNLGDLKTATLKDGAASPNTLDTRYYRYYTPTDVMNGYVHGLKYVFNYDSYARLKAAYSNPFAATNAQVAPYADNYFEYGDQGRVAKEVVQGAGSAQGRGTFTYTYTPSGRPDGFNVWKYKTVEVLPDDAPASMFVSRNTVYTNFAGEVMLRVYETGTTGSTRQWIDYYRYDDPTGRMIWHALPSAVTGFSEANADLLAVDAMDRSTFLRDDAGLIEAVSYYGSTTATEQPYAPGGALGYQYQTRLRRGDMTGAGVLQSTADYAVRTGSDGSQVFPVAHATMYRDTAAAQPQTTTNTFTWQGATTQMATRTVARPAVPDTQNGPNVATTEVTSYDSYGRATEVVDADGFHHTTGYDLATGAVTSTVTDAGDASP